MNSQTINITAQATFNDDGSVTLSIPCITLAPQKIDDSAQVDERPPAGKDTGDTAETTFAGLM